MKNISWEHKPRKVPELDELDLKTIVLLVKEYGEKHIPIYSKRIMEKVNKSLIAYEFEKNFLKKANEKYGRN